MHARANLGKSLVSALALVFGTAAGSAWAAGIDTLPAVQVHITSDLGIDSTVSVADMACGALSGYSGFAASCVGYGYDLGGASLESVEVQIVVDPQVSLNLSLTNTSINPQTFTLETSLPVDPFGGPNLMGGSVGGSLTETNGNGATLSSPSGSSVYSALIDGVVVQQLLGSSISSYSVSANPLKTVPVGPADFGLTGPNLVNAPAPSVNSSIGIRLRFTLSPGDQASLTSVFVVQTPEPAIAGLLGVGALALLGLRRAARRA
jgi:hypothetical protein